MKERYEYLDVVILLEGRSKSRSVAVILRPSSKCKEYYSSIAKVLSP